MDNVGRIYGDRIQLCKNQYDALKGADALAIVTEWSVFRTPDFEQMKVLMDQAVIFDGRNLYSLEAVSEMGFHYESIGRGTVQ